MQLGAKKIVFDTANYKERYIASFAPAKRKYNISKIPTKIECINEAAVLHSHGGRRTKIYFGD